MPANLADSRDAVYLACQLKTNGVIIHQTARLERALSALRQHLLEVTEESRLPVRVNIPVPHIDMSPSHPRSAFPPPTMDSGDGVSVPSWRPAAP